MASASTGSAGTAACWQRQNFPQTLILQLASFTTGLFSPHHLPYSRPTTTWNLFGEQVPLWSSTYKSTLTLCVMISRFLSPSPSLSGTPPTLHRLLLLRASVVHFSSVQLKHRFTSDMHSTYPRCSLRTPRRQAGPSTVIRQRRSWHYFFPVFRLSLNVCYSTVSPLDSPAFFLSLFNATSASVRLIVITARRILYPIRAAGLTKCCGVRFRLITDSVFWALLRTHSVFLTETCSGRHEDLRSPSLLRAQNAVEFRPLLQSL